MSEVQNTTPVAPAEPVAEATTTITPAPAPETVATAEAQPATTETEAAKPDETTTAPAETKAEEKAEEKPTTEASATESKEEKAVEPITEGQLGYKAPGLLKQFTFSKKEFWLSDSPVTPQNLDLYLRGEKSEVSHPVVAWASETGKGLLFFTKKGSERAHPAGVLPLYDATDLKKMSPHEFSFELQGHKHSFKATSDAERDGWYLAIEKAVELGKASKENVRESESYKAEMEKLNTPSVIGGVASAPKSGSQSQPKKSADMDKSEPNRAGSSSSDEPENKKAKSRSTSRGMFNKLKGKKDEVEAKKEEKKEEKEEKKEEKEAEKEAEKTGEAAPAAATGAALDAPATADRATAAPTEEQKQEPVEALPTATETATPETKTAAPETKAEEKPKTSKRGSIFGRIPGAWSMKSPVKEKEQKDAELKPDVPPKDAGVSENPPVLPETAATEPIDSTAPATDATKPEINEPASETAKSPDAVTPNREKKNFLSGLGFMNKRDRSASPSALNKNETPTSPAKEESATEPAKTEEPAAETPAAATTTTAAESTEKPEEKAAETKPAEQKPADTTPGNKRSSMLGNLGRRASKAFGGMKTPKKENTAPATEPKAEPKAETAVADKESEAPAAVPVAAEENKENKPEAVGTAAPAPVAASA